MCLGILYHALIIQNSWLFSIQGLAVYKVIYINGKYWQSNIFGHYALVGLGQMITSKFEKQGIFAPVHSSSQTFNFPYININKRQVWNGHNFDYLTRSYTGH